MLGKLIFSGCGQKDCTTQAKDIKYEDLIKHLSVECGPIVFNCPLKCGAKIERSGKMEHIKVCPAIKKICSKCKIQGSQAHNCVDALMEIITQQKLQLLSIDQKDLELSRYKLENAHLKEEIQRLKF